MELSQGYGAYAGGETVKLFSKLIKANTGTDEQTKVPEETNPSISSAGPEAAGSRSCETTNTQNHAGRLTPREHDLFLLLLEGFTLKECAERLNVKYSTANTHMTSIYKKLAVNSRAELIIRYRRL